MILRWVLVAAATYVAACLLLLAGRRRLLFPGGGGGTGEPARFGLSDGRRVEIPTADGERLVAWYLPPRDSSGRSGAVLWLHGNAETVEGLAPVFREFRPPRAALLALEYRGYGASSGRTTTDGVSRDAEAGFDWLAARADVDPARIVVYGRSVGAGPAAHVAATRPVSGLVLESAFTSLRAMARRHFPFAPSFLAGAAFDNLAAVSRVRAPLLLVHGEVDDLVPPAMSRALAARAGERAELWLIPGAGHNETYDVGDEAYVRQFRDFVARWAETPR